MAHALLMKIFQHPPGFIDLAGPLKQPSPGDFNCLEMLRVVLPGYRKIVVTCLEISPLLRGLSSAKILP